MRRVLAALCLVTALVAHAPNASAEPAAAEVLFQEGRALLAEGKLAEACDKFESSHAREPSSGTLLNLADCREKQGKTATAWAHFVAAERLARAQGRSEHETEASRRARTLEPQLSWLTLRVESAPPGLAVRLNGRALDLGSLGQRTPADPGPVVVDASAPGYRDARVEGKLGAAGRELTLVIPALERAPSADAPPAKQETPATESEGPGALPWLVVGTGAAFVAAGGAFGLLALSANAEAERLCDDRTTDCPNEALEKESERDRFALLSTIGIGVGLAGVAVGTVLLLGSDSSPSAQGASSLTLATAFGPSRAAVQARLTF